METATTSTRGGFRLGSGRKRGMASIKAEETRKYLVSRIVTELEPIIAGQIELAKGAYREVEEEGQVKRIYARLPDSRVAAHLLNQILGPTKEILDTKPPLTLRELIRQKGYIEAGIFSDYTGKFE